MGRAGERFDFLMFRRLISRIGQLRALPEERLLFDETFYLARYRDVAAAGVDPFEHYCATGWREGRHPSPLFDPDWYASQLVAGLPEGVRPLLHYLQTGAARGYSTSPLFDGAAYAAYRQRQPGPDFVPLLEFLKAPPEPGFDPNPMTDTAWFLERYPETLQGGENWLLHFARSGAWQGVDPSPEFDCAWYLLQYEDVAASPWNPLAHYLAVGRYEGRSPLPPGAQQADGTRRRGREILVGAHEAYGEYTARYVGDTRVIPDDPGDEKAVWCGRLAVHLHVFYPESIELIGAYLANLPVDFDLFVSVTDCDTAHRVETCFRRLPRACKLQIETVPNVGRDIAPLLVTFRDELAGYDLVMHLHSKRSVHTDEKRDWAVQMLHHLLASEAHAGEVLGLFSGEADLALVFPVYHPAVRDQINWGSNRRRVAELLRGMGQDDLPAVCPPFPAGSFFICRPAILKPLWRQGLGFADFEAQSGALDGTLAHAVERVLGLLPGKLRQRACQIRSERPHSLTRAWIEGRAYRSPLLDLSAPGAPVTIPAAELNAEPLPEVTVYSCATGGYDVALPVEHALAGAQYQFFTETGGGVSGLWQLRPLHYDASDAVRCARMHKTSPHLLFPAADIAVWVDANIALTGDISGYVEKVLAADACFGLVRHPVRKTRLAEAEALRALGIEQGDVLEAQLAAYRTEGCPDELELTETNFMIMDLRRPETRAALDIWRGEITRHSVRDQLSFDYARWKAGASSVWLFEEGGSVRSNSRFAYFSHGGDGHTGKDLFSGRACATRLHGRFHDVPLSEARARAEQRSVDVVMTVHNAPEDVRASLAAMNLCRDAGQRLIMVDDGSGAETAAILKGQLARYPQDLLIGHETALGYTRAANAGMRISTAEVVVLLNSDAQVTPGALRRLVAALERNQSAGLAGPLSNAATWQSVPEQVDGAGDYVENPLPAGKTPADMAALCAQIPGERHVMVPALSGFCLAICRSVIDTVGYLDEVTFPQGYGEETDYCFRAADAGFKLTVATDAYVFHAKSRSFGHERRKILSLAGYQALQRRYGAERLERAVRMLQSSGRLEAVRRAFGRVLEK